MTRQREQHTLDLPTHEILPHRPKWARHYALINNSRSPYFVGDVSLRILKQW